MSCKCGSDRIASVNGKCSDCCYIRFSKGNDVEGYVPSNLNIGGGDYIKFSFCMDCGLIQDDFPLPVLEEEEEDTDGLEEDVDEDPDNPYQDQED